MGNGLLLRRYLIRTLIGKTQSDGEAKVFSIQMEKIIEWLLAVYLNLNEHIRVQTQNKRMYELSMCPHSI